MECKDVSGWFDTLHYTEVVPPRHAEPEQWRDADTAVIPCLARCCLCFFFFYKFYFFNRPYVSRMWRDVKDKTLSPVMWRLARCCLWVFCLMKVVTCICAPFKVAHLNNFWKCTCISHFFLSDCDVTWKIRPSTSLSVSLSLANDSGWIFQVATWLKWILNPLSYSQKYSSSARIVSVPLLAPLTESNRSICNGVC